MRPLVALLVTLAFGAAPALAFVTLRPALRALGELPLAVAAGLVGLLTLAALAGPPAGLAAAVWLRRRLLPDRPEPALSRSAVVAGAWGGLILGLLAFLLSSFVLEAVGHSEPEWPTALAAFAGSVLLGSWWGGRPAAAARRHGTQLGCSGLLVALLCGVSSAYVVRQQWVTSRAERARAAVSLGMATADVIAAADAAGSGPVFRVTCLGADGSPLYEALRLEPGRYTLIDPNEAGESASTADRNEWLRRLAARQARECRRLRLGFAARDTAGFEVRLDDGRARELGAVSFTPD